MEHIVPVFSPHKNPVPFVAVLGNAESFLYYTNLQQWYADNPVRETHVDVLANYLLRNVSLICVCTVTDFESLQRSTVRYLRDHRPTMWQTIFPIDWTPTLTNQYMDFIVESSMPIQIDMSRPECMGTEHRAKFFPPEPDSTKIEWVPDIPLSAFNDREQPYRKKWEK